MSDDSQGVLVIGMDGGTYDVIRPLVWDGDLPHLAPLITKGVSVELLSTVPPITALAWISFMTGRNPGKHGFFYFVGNTHWTHRGNALSFADLKVQTLRSVLGKHGKRLILLNVPMTYLPARVNGAMVLGLGARLDAQDITGPPCVSDELREQIGEYERYLGCSA